MMPKSFFSDDGFGITAEARRYFAPYRGRSLPGVL